MKRLFISVLLMAFIMPITAQITHTAQGSVDKNADEVLQKAKQSLDKECISFTVTMTNRDSNKKVTAKEKADVIYKQGSYRVTFGDNVIYCDGKSTWHWNKEAGEVVVNNMSDAEDDLMNPAALLSNYKKNFKAKYIRKESNGDAVIDLTPKKTKSYHKIRIIIDSRNRIKKMEMHNYDSSSAEYAVSDYSLTKIHASAFTFPKEENPKVEIIDMR